MMLESEQRKPETMPRWRSVPPDSLQFASGHAAVGHAHNNTNFNFIGDRLKKCPLEEKSEVGRRHLKIIEVSFF